jgi:hypothetical protein
MRGRSGDRDQGPDTKDRGYRERGKRKAAKMDNFYLFRSNIQHVIKREGMDAISYIIDSGNIRNFYVSKDYLKSLYLLSCLDTLCIEYELPLCGDYDDIRKCKLKAPVFLGNEKREDESYLPEFAKHNIYEVSIHDVC